MVTLSLVITGWGKVDYLFAEINNRPEAIYYRNDNVDALFGFAVKLSQPLHNTYVDCPIILMERNSTRSINIISAQTNQSI